MLASTRNAARGNSGTVDWLVDGDEFPEVCKLTVAGNSVDAKLLSFRFSKPIVIDPV